MSYRPTGKFVYECAPRPVSPGCSFQVKPYGYLDSLEIRFVEPMPNMDASRPMSFQLSGINFRPVEFSVISVYQQVEEQ